MKHFPLLFFILYQIVGCNNENSFEKENTNDYRKLVDKGDLKSRIQEYDSAYYYYNESLNACDVNQADRKIFSYTRLAEIQNIRCDFAGAEENLVQSFKYIKNAKNKIYIQDMYNELGKTFQEQANHQDALIYYKKALIDNQDPLYINIIKNNIGVVYIDKKEPEKAITTLKPLLKDKILKENPIHLAKILDNLGFAYLLNDDYEKAYNYLNKSIKIRDSINNDYEKIASYIHFSLFYKDNPTLSKEFAQNAYQFATNVNSPDDRLEALDLLIKNPTNKNAISNYERYYSLSDSITKVRQTDKKQFSEIKYNSKIAIERSEKLEVEKDLITYFFIGFGIIAILIYFLIRSKNKRKLQKSAYETETRISKQLHDELANDVFNVMTQMETEDFPNIKHKERIVNQLETIYKRTRNISIENSEIDTGEHFNEHLKSLISSFNSESVNVIVKNFDVIDWKKTKDLTKIAIYRAIQELLVNMKKHSQGNLAVISFENKSKEYQINYSDNGVFGHKTLKLKNGLLNMENRIKSIKGRITFETENQKGFKVKINFPK